jgi:hypothetical protein
VRRRSTCGRTKVAEHGAHQLRVEDLIVRGGRLAARRGAASPVSLVSHG